MLLISLIVSGIMLAVSIHFYGSGKGVKPGGIIGCAAFGIAPAFLTCFLPAVILQTFILISVTIYCSLRGYRPRDFAIAAGLGSVLPYLVIGWLTYRDLANARERYPYESLVDRLPPVTKRSAAPLPEVTGNALLALEEAVDHGMQRHYFSHRRAALEALHERAVELFAEQPGFGAIRMPGMSIRAVEPAQSEPTPLQPGTLPSEFLSAADIIKPAAAPVKDESSHLLDLMHRDSIVDFVHLPTLGFFKDREHVAGFAEHRFTKVPSAGARWKLRTIELIGLVVHEQPVAYVSTSLPRMDELRKAPKRPLDGFELRALEALRGGEELFVGEAGAGQRVLGAIRAAKQCVDCHAVERGHLLGAFTYTLTRRDP